jgi:4-amino-4-deoxy-L-arabinose transferase-like glycosyltransferase
MSDVPALFFILLGIVTAVKYANIEKTVFIYLFYFAAGFACLIRYASALMFVIIGLYLILSNKIHLLKRKEVWIGTLLFLVIVSPQLIYNHIYFGSPFTTGYSQYSQTHEQMFSLAYIFTSWDRRPPFQIISYIKYLILGCGSPILLFYIYGMWDLIKTRNREELSLIIPWIVVPFVIFSCYYWNELRFIISVLPALLILSGLGFSKMCDRLGIKAENNKIKQNKTRLSNFKTIKIVLIILLVVILLVPTAMYSINSIQQREAGTECQKKHVCLDT